MAEKGFDEDVSPLYQVRLTVNDYFSVLLHLHFFFIYPALIQYAHTVQEPSFFFSNGGYLTIIINELVTGRYADVQHFLPPS